MKQKGKTFDELQESIFILVTLQALLDEYRICLIKEKKEEETVLYSIITSQIIITSCSFLEEWERLGKYAKDDGRIINLRKITKPALDRIYVWKDMRKVRNSVLAHGLRFKSRSALHDLPQKLDCPSSFFDYQLLMGCIYITKNIMLKIFKAEYNDIIPKLTKMERRKPVNPIENENVYDKEFSKIIDIIQEKYDISTRIS